MAKKTTRRVGFADRFRLNDIAILALAVTMSVAANLPESARTNIDRRFLLAGLVGIVVVALVKYLKFTLLLLVVTLAFGCNLPEDVASALGIDTTVAFMTLVSMVVISLANRVMKLPTGLTEYDKTVSSKLHGATALFNAIGGARPSTVRALLQQGVSPNCRAAGGETPLMYAVAKRQENIVRLLLERGADANLQDKKGLTALKVAEIKGYIQIAEILKRHKITHRKAA